MFRVVEGIDSLAEQLMVERDWTCPRVAEEVNARIVGAHASEKSVRRHASRMRRRGDTLDPKRQP